MRIDKVGFFDKLEFILAQHMPVKYQVLFDQNILFEYINNITGGKKLLWKANIPMKQQFTKIENCDLAVH